MSHNSYGLQVKFSHYPHMLYIASPNSTTLSCKLSWSHYVEILKGDAPLETGFYVILIKSCLCILFPKSAINAAFQKQNNIPYFLGQIIDATLYQCITHSILSWVNLYICLYVNIWVMQISMDDIYNTDSNMQSQSYIYNFCIFIFI